MRFALAVLGLAATITSLVIFGVTGEGKYVFVALGAMGLTLTAAVGGDVGN